MGSKAYVCGWLLIPYAYQYVALSMPLDAVKIPKVQELIGDCKRLDVSNSRWVPGAGQFDAGPVPAVGVAVVCGVDPYRVAAHAAVEEVAATSADDQIAAPPP